MREPDLHKAFMTLSNMAVELRHTHNQIFDLIPSSTSQTIYATADLLEVIESALHDLYDETQK